MKTLEQYKELDDLVCDEVNVKAFNRTIMTSPQVVELQYVRSQRAYNIRVNGSWLKQAPDDFALKILTEWHNRPIDAIC